MRTSSRMALAGLVGAAAITTPVALAANTITVTAPNTVKAGKNFTLRIAGTSDSVMGVVDAIVQNASKSCPASNHLGSNLVVSTSVNQGPFKLKSKRSNAATKQVKRRFCAYLFDDQSKLVGKAHVDFTLKAK